MSQLALVMADVHGALRQLGGFGLLAMGVLDNSFIPTPGGQDLLLIILAARHREWWGYYTLMAILGSLLGGWIVYRIGRRGGERTLEGRWSPERQARLRQAFARWGFGTVFVSAIMPPPMPIAPVLLGAGALAYPGARFLAALAAARTLRYVLVGYLASVYGRRVSGLIDANWTTILAVVLGAVLAAVSVRAVYQRYAGRRVT
jgi:membrane protein YqaA with SNARE-associated domain